MAKKLIEMYHMMDDHECMWNGIEDIYMEKSGERLPPFFFFTLAGTGNFIYHKEQRRVAFSYGDTPRMYADMCGVIGFSYEQTKSDSFDEAMALAKSQIDLGKPVVLGCMDMYYLPYYHALYRRFHIPIHYNLMVGYDDEERWAYVHECGLEGVAELSYELLEKALNIAESPLSGKNGVCLVELEKTPKKLVDIARRGYEKKALRQLSGDESNGVAAMRRFASELDGWAEELSDEDYENFLRNTVMFTGTVPKLPNRVLGAPFPDDIRFMAAFEKLSAALAELAERYSIPDWEKAAKQFYSCGEMIERLSMLMADCLLSGERLPAGTGAQVEKIADAEEAAYRLLLSGCKS